MKNREKIHFLDENDKATICDFYSEKMKTTEIETEVTCKKCLSSMTGLTLHTKLITKRVPDNKATGEAAKKFRKSGCITLLQLSNYTQLSISYLSDLENGRKKWTYKKLLWYENACKRVISPN